jgi:HPt (histidine-containing phosphotransfer) domain-containing protein
MRNLLGAVAVVLSTSLIALPAAAQQTNPQQERMKLCNKQAGDQKLTGDARKTFMSDCLSGKTTTAKPLTAQQQKMKDCNATATAQKLSGDARKSFMSSCLKGS